MFTAKIQPETHDFNNGIENYKSINKSRDINNERLHQTHYGFDYDYNDWGNDWFELPAPWTSTTTR